MSIKNTKLTTPEATASVTNTNITKKTKSKYMTGALVPIQDKVSRDIFKEILSNNNIHISTVANSDEDKKAHWDYLLRIKDKLYKTELKGIKKSSRQNNTFQNNWTWIELKGHCDPYVKTMNHGWLFGSEADYYCFIYEEDVVLISRAKLIKLVKSLIKDGTIDFEFVLNANDAKNKLYMRHKFGKNDIITQIESKHIIKNADYKFKYSFKDFSNKYTELSDIVFE